MDRVGAPVETRTGAVTERVGLHQEPSLRAIFYDRQGPAHDVLQLGSVGKPVAGDGEVLVRIHASGVNPSDIKNRTGFTGPMKFERVVPHQDGAGVIEAVGPNVASSRIGERVWIYEGQTGRAFGTAADYIALPASHAVPLPDAVSFETGATIGVPVITAHRCLFADGALARRRVLVQGAAGAVGTAAVQLAKWAGAWVSATVRKHDQIELAHEAGADLVLMLGRDDVPSAIHAATGGAGVDRIVDVALASNLKTDLSCLAKGGVISAYATQSGGEELAIPTVRAIMTNAVIRFVYIYAIPESAKAEAVSDITQCLSDGGLRPRIALTVPLDRTADAHVAVDTRAVSGRALILLSDAVSKI